MLKISKIGVKFLFSILFIIMVIGLPEGTARASTTTLPSYSFRINSTKVTGDYELKTSQTQLSVVADGWAAPTTVEWQYDKGVVDLVPTAGTAIQTSPTLITNTNSVTIVRKGPGYSPITANITQGGYTYSISFTLKVDLQVDYTKTSTEIADTNNSRAMVLDPPTSSSTTPSKKRIYLKYYTPADVTDTTGSEIDTSAVTFESDDEGVATVDQNGWVTAVGGGSTSIIITSNTMSSKDMPMVIKLTVVVTPTFSFTYTDSNNVSHTCVSKPDSEKDSAIYNNVPSSFTLNTDAKPADNLTWVVYNVVTGQPRTKIPAGESSKMTYTVNDSGTVYFTGIKAGTYEIYAFAGEKYGEDSGHIPYAYMKISVPIDIGTQNIVMSVGDTYDVYKNSNIPDKKVFNTPTSYDTTVVLFDATNYVITAKKEGTTTITFVYDDGQGLFKDSVANINLKITVIDGIALSTTKATLYTQGTLQLAPVVTDNTSPITWNTSNAGIATVKDGLVTGVKKGTCFITASQTIKGVVKTAICEITVQESVSSIVVDPATTTLAIKGYTTVHATVSPTNLSGVSLKWKSSDESVVKIVESSALTATIQGVAGGHAVISAINQDNVVVGYCHVTVQQSVTGITLSETDVTQDLSVKQLQLRATVSPDNAINKTVKWSSTDTTKATVDSNGLVTLLKPGTVTIVATSDDNAKSVAYCNIHIQIPVVSISLDETKKTMFVGESARLSYVLSPSNASNNSVTWTSTNTTVATVDSTGKVSAKGVGTAVIILQALDGGYSVYCNVTVKQVATAIRFDVKDIALKTGSYYYIKATLTPTDSTETDITWESSNSKVATVDKNGKVTAKSAGTAIIMARTQAGGLATCNVTVTQPVSGLVINFTEKTIYKGEKLDLIVSVSPSTATKLDVTWKSSNTKVATVTNKGEVTGIIGGVAVITCTTVDGGYSVTCVVTVKETVTSVKLNYDTYKIGVKKSVILTATAASETATNQKVKWTSSNTKIAVVNQKGKVTGVKVGYATITATALDGSDAEASCEIQVVNPVTSVTLSRSTLFMYVGDSKKLKAAIKPKTATYKKAKWSSSDDSIALVDEDGAVIAVKAGNATITAEALDNSGKKAICYVTVHDRVSSTGVTLQDKAITMVPGEQKAVNVVLVPAVSTDGVKWSTDNAAIASVNKKTGRITAKATGTAYITVMTDSGKTATVEVTVIGLNISKLYTEEYTTYSNALSVEGTTSTVTWRSDNPMIAVVSSDGTVSTRGVGTATITATVNGRRLHCKVIVRSM